MNVTFVGTTNLGVVIPSLPHCRLSSTFLPAALPVYFCQDEDKDARRNVRWEEMEKEAIVTAAAAPSRDGADQTNFLFVLLHLMFVVPPPKIFP